MVFMDAQLSPGARWTNRSRPILRHAPIPRYRLVGTIVALADGAIVEYWWRVLWRFGCRPAQVAALRRRRHPRVGFWILDARPTIERLFDKAGDAAARESTYRGKRANLGTLSVLPNIPVIVGEVAAADQLLQPPEQICSGLC